mmetsp:Transcript_2513/g.5532  ORF Transcript_2513/g.5532 Transcript_2513/m.5532 type:complete len:259 (-) Transcript_2513:1347-2123(-)
MVTKPMQYLGLGLALLASDLCLLLLTLNCLSWMNILHMDLTFMEQAAETIFAKQWQLYFQTATMAWLMLVLISAVQSGNKVGVSSDENKEETKETKYSNGGAVMKSISIVVLTLLTPHMLKPHRHRHPILRRSLIIGPQSTLVINNQHHDGGGGVDSVNTNDEATITSSVTRQELVFSVDNMTCGGCGSHVRNLVEANLNQQEQSSSSSSMSIDKVAVDWRAGVLSIYGGDLKEFVDQSVIIEILKKEGYPTSFLYVN